MDTPSKLRSARLSQIPPLTQDAVDEIAGVTPGRTFSYEAGRARPKPMYLRALARAWFRREEDWEWFLDPSETPPPNKREGAVFQLEVEDNSAAPVLRIGDRLTVSPSGEGRADVLVLAEWPDGGREILEGRRERGEFTLRPITEAQRPPDQAVRQVGHLVALERELGHGLTVSYRCETGLTRGHLPG